jgi:iron complex transport system substrate-binding protein
MTTTPRIVSFLPSATEIVFTLGLGEQLIGVTHECDYPPEARSKTVVVRNVLPLETMTQVEIDQAVAERIHSGQSLYQIDESLLQELAPDVILTQNLCQVCAPSGNEVSQVLNALAKKPQIVWMTPRSLAEIEQNIRELGEVTGHSQQAEKLIEDGRARMDQIAELARSVSHRPKVFFFEWLDPIYCGGHWVPEMIKIAGGVDELGQEGADSVRIPWADVVKWAPEVLVIAPCGFNLEQVRAQVPQLFALPGWSDLPAVRNGRVYAVDANSYFARPGPRVVDGTELLAHLFHPDLFDWHGSPESFRRIEATGHVTSPA